MRPAAAAAAAAVVAPRHKDDDTSVSSSSSSDASSSDIESSCSGGSDGALQRLCERWRARTPDEFPYNDSSEWRGVHHDDDVRQLWREYQRMLERYEGAPERAQRALERCLVYVMNRHFGYLQDGNSEPVVRRVYDASLQRAYLVRYSIRGFRHCLALDRLGPLLPPLADVWLAHPERRVWRASTADSSSRDPGLFSVRRRFCARWARARVRTQSAVGAVYKSRAASGPLSRLGKWVAPRATRVPQRARRSRPGAGSAALASRRSRWWLRWWWRELLQRWW